MNNDDENNIIRIPSLAERDRLKREKESNSLPPAEPFINLPKYTKLLLATLIIIHIITIIIKHFSPLSYDYIVIYLSFIPASWSNNTDFLITTIITPFTHMLIHSGILHISTNIIMGAIFATITERWIGGKKMLILFIVGGLIGSFTHFAIEPSSIVPLVGASGGISALFGSAALMMFRSGMLGQGTGVRHPLFMFLGIWIAISLIFAVISPGTGNVAWAAHLGGMLGGLAYAKFIMKL